MDKIIEKIYRYSLNDGEAGGIVIADNAQEALQKATEMCQ